jgi:hypothetical protein
MTYADEEFMTAEGQEETPNYPTAFGITFTPTIGGIIIGVIGLWEPPTSFSMWCSPLGSSIRS